jgi:folylpolyglutamate synthase/dihydropteroate synthase
MLFSCLADKPVEAMAEHLRPVVGEVALCLLEDDRAMDLEGLRRGFETAAFTSDPLEALELLPDPVLAAGSLRLAGALLAHQEEIQP